jgi:DNA-binding transcriptional MocR family regulator
LEALLRYQPHGGRQHERATVARHLSSRGLQVDSDRVLIVNGAQHGLATTVMALLQPGDVVAVDALTYPGFKVLAEVHRLELAPIPMADLGPDLDALERLCKNRRVRAVYAMPTLHNPLGSVMNAQQRQRLVSIARRHGLLLIEDAAYAFLAEEPPAPLSALAPETTVYVSGLSKSVSTGLRVGFVAAPPQWVPMIQRTIRATTWNTPGVMTAIACAWLDDGTVVRLEAQKRRDAMTRQSISDEVLAGLRCIRHPASYFVWIPLAEEARADQVAMALMRENVSVSTAEPFATSAHVPHALRLALGSVELDALKGALEKVKRVIEGHSY